MSKRPPPLLFDKKNRRWVPKEDKNLREKLDEQLREADTHLADQFYSGLVLGIGVGATLLIVILLLASALASAT